MSSLESQQLTYVINHAFLNNATPDEIIAIFARMNDGKRAVEKELQQAQNALSSLAVAYSAVIRQNTELVSKLDEYRSKIEAIQSSNS